MFVVTLPAKASSDPRAYAIWAKEAGADILEVRGDLTPRVQPFDSPLPILVSPRGTGAALIDAVQPTYLDLERGEEVPIPSSATVIRSFHDCERTTPVRELQKIADALIAEGADIVKIATLIRSYGDIATLQALHDLLAPTQKRVILGMGERAHLARMLSPIRNALTYTYLKEGEQAAPGQVPLSVYGLTSHCRHPKIFGLLGGPACLRSLSPLLLNTLFSLNGVDAIYSLFPTEDLQDFWDAVPELGIGGFAVTTPWKREVVSLLDRLESTAKVLNSVNLVVREGQKWIGHNVDVDGITGGYPFLRGLGCVAIIGSGGVVPAVIEACRRKGVGEIRIYARNAEARSVIGGQFSVPTSDLSELPSAQVDVLVCAISEDIDVQLPEAQPGAHAIDLRYSVITNFLTRARSKGYEVHNGLPMLLAQVPLHFRLFTGITPTAESVRSLQTSLSSHGEQ